MIWAAALLVVAAVVAILQALKVPRRALAVLDQGRSGWLALRNPSLSERDKELAARHHARRLLALGLGLSLASATALALPFGVIALLDVLGLIDFDAVLQRTLSPWFALVVATVGVCATAILRRSRP